MNIINYHILNKMNDTRELDKIYIENLYKYYKEGSQVFNYNIKLEKNEFKKLSEIIYDVLKLRVHDRDFKTIIKHYTELLMADAKDGDNVNINWAINHIWYLSVGISKKIDSNKYKDCILFIQQKLLKEFDVKENINQKVRRKIYTNCLINH